MNEKNSEINSFMGVGRGKGGCIWNKGNTFDKTHLIRKCICKSGESEKGKRKWL